MEKVEKVTKGEKDMRGNVFSVVEKYDGVQKIGVKEDYVILEWKRRKEGGRGRRGEREDGDEGEREGEGGREGEKEDEGKGGEEGEGGREGENKNR